MKVSLVATVKDAAREVQDFVVSVDSQTRRPDEVVIVDGGSTDGTLETLRQARGVTLVEEPGSNIAEGRNAAVRAATHELVAVSDADCVLAPDWLERIVAPLERGADVSMGIYRPLATTLFETCAAAVSIPEPDEIEERRWLPSARSIAFRREVFDRAGGYPEWLDLGEDTYLHLRWRELGVDMRLARDAVVFRRPRATVAAYWRQFSGYAEADGLAGLHPRRHALRFGVYGAVAVALASRRRAALALIGGAAAARAARPLRRALRLLPPRAPVRAAVVAAVPALIALTDVAKMAGYLRGLRQRHGASPSS